MRIQELGIVLLLLFLSSPLYSIELEEWLKENSSELKEKKSKESFKSFPFKDYMLDISLEDIKTLDEARNIINKYELKGDRFIISLFESHMESVILNSNDIPKLEERIKLAETLGMAHKFLGDDAMVYSMVSDVLFSITADSIQSWIYEKKVDKNDFEIKFLIKKLIDNKFIINFPPNNFEKIIKYAKEGRWKYIFNKLTTTYVKEFSIAIISILAFMSFIVFFIRRWRKKKKSRN